METEQYAPLDFENKSQATKKITEKTLPKRNPTKKKGTKASDKITKENMKSTELDIHSGVEWSNSVDLGGLFNNDGGTGALMSN